MSNQIDTFTWKQKHRNKTLIPQYLTNISMDTGHVINETENIVQRKERAEGALDQHEKK